MGLQWRGTSRCSEQICSVSLPLMPSPCTGAGGGDKDPLEGGGGGGRGGEVNPFGDGGGGGRGGRGGKVDPLVSGGCEVFLFLRERFEKSKSPTTREVVSYSEVISVHLASPCFL